MHPQPREMWGDGAAYELYVGRGSHLIALEFVRWVAAPDGGLWLDVGCGTGRLGRSIFETAGPRRVDGIDRSFRYTVFAKEERQVGLLNVAAGDAQALPMATGTYDAVVSGLVLNLVPEPQRAVGEMARVARSGGFVAAYVWDYEEGMEFMRHFWDAAIALDAAAIDLDEGRRFPVCHPQPVVDLFQSVGLKDVKVRAIDIATPFRDFDDYWFPFLGGQGPAPTYLLSLSAERQVALRERVRGRLPVSRDGSITLVARAWAVRGYV